MESQAKYTLVGLLVAVLSIAIVVAALWFSNIGTYRNADNYEIFFKEHTLDGLQIDSDVTMKGIKIGSVAELEIDEDNIEKVRVRIRVNRGTPIKTDTRAIIKRSLLTGWATIDLIGGTQVTTPLQEAQPGAEYPRILEGRSDLDSIADSFPALVEQVGGITGRVERFLSPENEEVVANILKNLEITTATLADNRTKLTETIDALHKVVTEFEDAGTTVKKTIVRVSERVDAMSEGLAEMLDEASELVANADARTSEVALSIRNAAEVLVQQVSDVGQDISTAAHVVATVLESLDDPEALLGGPSADSLGPGERVLE